MDAALTLAKYDYFGQEGWAGSIPGFPGLLVIASTQSLCKDSLRSALEGWILVGLPVIPAVSTAE
jgi:hypothetical protein